MDAITTRRGKARRLGLSVACFTVAAVLATSSVAFGQDEGDEEFTLVFAQAHLSDPFQQILLDQLEAQAQAQGGSLVATSNANDDPAKQVTDISTLLAASPDGLLIAPVDAEAIVPAIDQAADQGVAVVSIDQAPAGGDVDMVVRADNVRMGETACQEMGRLLEGEGTVLELQGDLASANGLQRTTGFIDCISENFPDITVIQQPTEWQMELATTNAQTVLSTQEVDGIYWASDFFLPGIRNVLQDLDMWHKVGEEGHIAIVGIDGTPEALEMIREGYQDATVSQPLDLYAQYGVQYARQAAEGMTFEEGPTDHDSTIVVQDNIPADELPAPLVTSESVDDPSLWANQIQ